MALKVSGKQIGSLQDMDTHPVRRLVQELADERKMLTSVLTGLVAQIGKIRIQPNIEVPAATPPQVSVTPPSRKRLTVHRDSAGRIDTIDIQEV